MRYCPPGWKQKFHFSTYMLWAVFWALVWRADWVYASDVFACPAALFLHVLCRKRVLYHEHDTPSAPSSRFIRLCLWCRALLARRAPVCVIPNGQRAAAFATTTQRQQLPTFVVRNCPRQSEVGPARHAQLQERLHLYFHGNLNRNMLPLQLLDAISILRGQVELHLVGYETIGSRGFTEWVRERSRALGIETYVHCHGPMSRGDLPQAARGADIGLALPPLATSNDNLRYLVGASNKPFDYLAAGLALLVTDSPAWREMYVRPGYGIACDPGSAQSIRDAVQWYLDNRHMVRHMGEQGRRRIASEWNYEMQFTPVLEYLERSVSN